MNKTVEHRIIKNIKRKITERKNERKKDIAGEIHQQQERKNSVFDDFQISFSSTELHLPLESYGLGGLDRLGASACKLPLMETLSRILNNGDCYLRYAGIKINLNHVLNNNIFIYISLMSFDIIDTWAKISLCQ